jgi:hypothetical protein
MSFIESLLGISPDGGSGTFELLLILIPVAALAVRQLARRFRIHSA